MISFRGRDAPSVCLPMLPGGSGKGQGLLIAWDNRFQMRAAAQTREDREEMTLRIPTGTARRIEEKAQAMRVTRDALVAVLLSYGLKAQEEKEREMESLVQSVRQADTPEQKSAALDVLGESIFGK